MCIGLRILALRVYVRVCYIYCGGKGKSGVEQRRVWIYELTACCFILIMCFYDGAEEESGRGMKEKIARRRRLSLYHIVIGMELMVV